MICDFRHGRSLTIEQQDLSALALPVLASRKFPRWPLIQRLTLSVSTISEYESVLNLALIGFRFSIERR